jgi:hypothetical protein
MFIFQVIRDNIAASHNFQTDMENWTVQNTLKVQETFHEAANAVRRKADISTVEVIA